MGQPLKREVCERGREIEMSKTFVRVRQADCTLGLNRQILLDRNEGLTVSTRGYKILPSHEINFTQVRENNQRNSGEKCDVRLLR